MNTDAAALPQTENLPEGVYFIDDKKGSRTFYKITQVEDRKHLDVKDTKHLVVEDIKDRKRKHLVEDVKKDYKDFTNTVITETFCECGENHAGMEQVGEMAAEGDGFTLEDLQQAAEFATSVFGCSCRIIDLSDGIRGVVGNAVPVEAVRSAYVLIITGLTMGVEEFKQLLDVKWDTKYFDTRRQKVLNKHARSNNIVGHFEQDADYENGKGTVVHFDRVPALKALLKERLHVLGERFKKLILAEGNRYEDGGAKKNGIGFHGDAERRLVVALRCGAVEGSPSMPMKFQWYYKNSPVGDTVHIELVTGDVYVMSEVAVGTDWRHSSRLTLRHATGANKYVTTKVTTKPKNKRQKVVE